jgi:ABC-type antimicrobial peptide transport system permease subunit
MKNKRINFKKFIKNILLTIYQFGTFILLLIFYLISDLVRKVGNWKYFPGFLKKKLQLPLSKFYAKVTNSLDAGRGMSISRIDLIELSIRNMKAKKNRTLVTIGGMTLGIGIIVFLVSIGYGLQELVVTRVARLEEMRQADVTPQSGGKVKINDKTLADFADISGVEDALPLIAAVARVNYQNSISDMVVYGVTADYLKQSAIKPAKGEIFESNKLISQSLEYDYNVGGVVAGAFTERAVFGEKIGDVEFTINPSSWVRVREGPSVTSKILGYTRHIEGISNGVEVWGSSYESEDSSGKSGKSENGETLGRWVKAQVLLWKEETCNSENKDDCEDGRYIVIKDENNRQMQIEGYFAELNLNIRDMDIRTPKVLGMASDLERTEESSESVVNYDSANNSSLDWVEIESESETVTPPETKTVQLSEDAEKQAIVNTAVLKVLGMKEDEAVGKKFNVSFVVVGDLLGDGEEKVESAPVEYTIVGVIPDDKTPFLYVPFIDLRSLGIVNYSQVKLIVHDQAELVKVRRQAEAMGFTTRSVVDTVEQINSLFSTLRKVLVLLGMVALFVAALGMFNTLTVSLLERTREVGLMKAMGMRSSEVQELFLTESTVMGFFGGIFGVLIGFIAGKLLSLVLSLFSVFKGVGFIDISYIPIPFIFIVILLSLFVGIITGIYPSKRATKISALNALRYE